MKSNKQVSRIEELVIEEDGFMDITDGSGVGDT